MFTNITFTASSFVRSIITVFDKVTLFRHQDTKTIVTTKLIFRTFRIHCEERTNAIYSWIKVDILVEKTLLWIVFMQTIKVTNIEKVGITA